MTPDIRLLGNEVLIRINKPERMTATKLLYIPETAKREPYETCTGTVVAAGRGKRDKEGKLIPVEVVPGDFVQFYFLAAHKRGVMPWGDGLIFINEKFIQAKIKDGEIVPLRDRVLVDPEEESVMAGAFHIPEAHQKAASYGTVVNHGNSELVQTGERIRFEPSSGTRIDREGKSLLLMREVEIQCVMEP